MDETISWGIVIACAVGTALIAWIWHCKVKYDRFKANLTPEELAAFEEEECKRMQTW